MKTIIAIFLLTIFCNGNPHYLINADALPNYYGTFFDCENGHVFSIDGERYSGLVVLVMNNKGTETVVDDVIEYVIIR